MKIAFLWHWNRASEIYPLWRDGLRAAMEIIGQYHEVKWYLDESIPPDTFDAYLIWGDSHCAAIDKIAEYKGKKGICLTTNPYNIENLKKLDVVFCESTPVYEEARMFGLHAVKAFGTDTHFFSPNPKCIKDIEYFYPATFSPWKRQHVLAHLGKKLTCIGTVQPDGLEELGACIKNKVKIFKGYLSAEDLLQYYRRTKRMIIPAIHGSERTVLEAMSMGILPQVEEENKKAHSYIEEFQKSGFKTPREFVCANYSAEKYAQTMLKGLK